MTIVVSDTEYQKIQELLDEIKNERARETFLMRLIGQQALQELEQEDLEDYYLLQDELKASLANKSFAEYRLSLLIECIF